MQTKKQEGFATYNRYLEATYISRAEWGSGLPTEARERPTNSDQAYEGILAEA